MKAVIVRILLLIGVGLQLACIPVSMMPPPEHYDMQDKEIGAVAFGPTPGSVAFGAQFWYLHRLGPKNLLGVKLHNLNTTTVSVIGGGLMFRHAFRNDHSGYLGVEAEAGSLYLRTAMLSAYRRERLQLYFSPGLQLQPDYWLSVNLPVGCSLWLKDNIALSLEWQTRTYPSEWLLGNLFFMSNPSLGVGFRW